VDFPPLTSYNRRRFGDRQRADEAVGAHRRRIGLQFLPDLAYLQLQARLAGKYVRMLGLKGGGGLRGWKVTVLLKQLHDQMSPLLQYLPVATLVVTPADPHGVPGAAAGSLRRSRRTRVDLY